MRLVFGAGALVAGVLLVLFGGSSFGMVPAIVAVVFVVCLFLFHSLTVAVTGEYVRLQFGIGLIRKRFAVADIERVAVVENRWYYGWGIRLTPHGWLYNVSGYDAVELQLKSGRTYRVGTDDPAALLSAIQSVAGMQQAG